MFYHSKLHCYSHIAEVRVDLSEKERTLISKVRLLMKIGLLSSGTYTDVPVSTNLCSKN